MRTFSYMEEFLKNRLLFGLIFVVCSTIFSMHYYVSRQAVYGDGIGYYAHLHSWVIDGDWDYTNEYQHIYSAENNNSLQPVSSDQIQIVGVTSNGKAENHYSPGVAVLLLPFYLAAHGISALLNVVGISVSLHGYGDIYQIMTGIGAICYLVLGLWLLDQIVYQLVKDRVVSRIAVLSVFFATQLLYYGSFDVINSHFASFFLVTYFYYVYTQRYLNRKKIFLLGITAGLITINRIQDSAIAVLWFIFEIKNIFSLSNVINLLKKCIIFLTGFVLALWPLLYHWQHTFNGIFQHTYIRNLERDLSWRSIDLLGSFFHQTTGLFTKSPILLIALVYFIVRVQKNRTPPYMMLFWFFVIEAMIITIQGGWYAAAYGGRMYISSLPFFALVLGELLLELKNKRRFLVYGLPLLFVVINIFTAVVFVLRNK